MTAVTLTTAAALCDLNPRTIRRKMNDGTVSRCASEGRGKTMVSLDDVLRLAHMRMADDERCLVEKADAGDPESIGDLGLLFMQLSRFGVARYWLELAADHGNVDAMHCMSHYYLTVEHRNDHLALMWLAKAAAGGHVIAQRQLAALRYR